MGVGRSREPSSRSFELCNAVLQPEWEQRRLHVKALVFSGTQYGVLQKSRAFQLRLSRADRDQVLSWSVVFSSSDWKLKPASGMQSTCCLRRFLRDGVRREEQTTSEGLLVWGKDTPQMHGRF